MFEIVKEYIRHVANTPNKLNNFVPNSHIGITFSEVLEFIEYYNSGEHKELFSKYDFEGAVNEVFICAKSVNDAEVIRAYQAIRVKDNSLRNLMMLLIIEDTDQKIMSKRVEKGMFKIYKNYESNKKL